MYSTGHAKVSSGLSGAGHPFGPWLPPCLGAAAGAGGTAGWTGRVEVGGRRGHSCSPRAAVPGRDTVHQGAGCPGSKLCPGGSRRRVPLRHPKPQEPQPRHRGLGQLCLPKLQQPNGRARSSSRDPGFPTPPSPPTDMGMLSPAALQRGPHDVPRAQRPPPARSGQ